MLVVVLSAVAAFALWRQSAVAVAVAVLAIAVWIVKRIFT